MEEAAPERAKASPSALTVRGFQQSKRSTKPPGLVEADEGAAERGEGEADVCAALVAHRQAPEAVQPARFSELLRIM